MKLSKEELAVGSVVALIWFYFSGPLTILTTIACAFFWALGGATGYSLTWRRVTVPIIICGACAINLNSWIPLISIIPFYGVLTLGYGIPD